MPVSGKACLYLFVSLFVALAANAQESDDDCYLCEEAAAVIEEYSLRESSMPVRDLEGWALPKCIVLSSG